MALKAAICFSLSVSTRQSSCTTSRYSSANLPAAATTVAAARRAGERLFRANRQISAASAALPTAMAGTMGSSFGPTPSAKARNGESTATVRLELSPAISAASASTALTQEPVTS